MSKIKALLLMSLCLTGTAYAGKLQNEDFKTLAELKSSVLTTTGTLSSGNACITSIGSTSHLATGQYVYDTTTPANISAGTTIAGVPGTCSAGQVQMSAVAAGNGPGDTITFGGQMSQLLNTNKIYDLFNSQQLSTTINNGQIGSGAATIGQVLTANGSGSTSWAGAATAPDSSSELYGVGINSSVGSNILTVALKQKDGSTNCSIGVPCKIGFRNATATTGGYSEAFVTGALSIATSVGASFGTTASVDQSIYIYTQYNSGTPEMCLSGSILDEGRVYTTTTIGSGSTDASVLYCSTGRSNQAIRSLGRITMNEATPGTYVSNASEISLQPFYKFVNSSGVIISTGATGSNTISSSFPSYTTFNNTNWTSRRTNYGSCMNPGTPGDLGCQISSLPRGKYLVQLSGEIGGSNFAQGCYYRVLETVSGKATPFSLVYNNAGQSGYPPLNVIVLNSDVTNANFVVQSARDNATNCLVDITNYAFQMDIIQL